MRPYKDEIAWIKSQSDRHFRALSALRDHLASWMSADRCGISRSARSRTRPQKAPRVAVAGPLISSVSREKLDLGDPPIVKIDTPEQAREFVSKLAAQNPDLVKIWYIVDKDHPVESFRPIVRATIEESHAHKIRVAVHATELETARAAVEEGADILVHSVTDKPVDDAFVKLLKDRHTILCPTLVVFERYGRTFSHQLNLTPEEKAWGNPEVIASLDVTKIPQDKLPDRIKNALAKSGCGAGSHQENLRSRAAEFENTGRCRRHDRRGNRRRKHRHDSWPGAFPRISVDEGSRSDADANSAMRYRERGETFRRRNGRAHRPDRKGQFCRSRHSQFESAQRHHECFRHRHSDQKWRGLSG